MRTLRSLLFIATLLSPVVAPAATRHVGSGQTYATVAAANTGIGNGDSIVIHAGTYNQDWVLFTANNLKIACVDQQGDFAGEPDYDVADRPIFDGQNVDHNQGIWRTGTSVNRIDINGGEFRNAFDSVGVNGAGIRIQQGGTGLFRIRNVYSHDNQMNILAAPESLLVESCELYRTYGTGNQHNIYVNTSATHWFMFRYNYSHAPSTGHCVKSRATNNYILYNRLLDGTIAGEAPTYNIDIPEHGLTYVIGNVLEQKDYRGCPSPPDPCINTRMLSYGAENTNNTNHHLYVFNNTFVNLGVGYGIFVSAAGTGAASDVQVTYKNNIFYGNRSTITEQKAGQNWIGAANNFSEADLNDTNTKFSNQATGDYHLTAATSASLVNAGVDPGTNEGLNCVPTNEYVYDRLSKTRTSSGSALDMGAFEMGLSTALSYFVPQAGSVSSPLEGTAAVPYFRACPNNDGTQVLADSARIKLVLLDLANQPIVGLPANEIFVSLNGGTAAQGFSGSGADSVIANFQYNQLAQCPDLRQIPSDAATDANGSTFITLKGAVPGSPGRSARDASRKWGHYDTEMPVFANGTKLQGRLTSGGPNGSYTLQVKNLDSQGGLTTAPDEGEQVGLDDINAVQGAIGQPYSFWLDFDWNGIVNAIDLAFAQAHASHGCSYPNNP
jgi:hypothetical protein